MNIIKKIRKYYIKKYKKYKKYKKRYANGSDIKT